MNDLQAQPTASSLFRPLMPVLAAGLFTSFFVTILSLALPLYMIQIFNRVLHSRSLETLLLLTVAVILALISQVVLDALRKSMHRKVGRWLARKLTEPSLDAFLRQTIERHGEIGQGFSDLRKCRDFVAGTHISSAFDLFWSPIFLIVLLLLHPVFSLICLTAVIALVALGVVNEIAIHKPQEEASLQTGRAGSHLQSAMRNAETIEAMGVLDRFTATWRAQYMMGLAASDLAAGRASVVKAVSTFVQAAAMIAIIGTAAYLIITEAIAGGVLIAAMILSRTALKPYGSMIANWREWVTAYGAFRRMRRLDQHRGRERSTMDLPRPEGGVVVDRVVFVPPGGDKAILQGVGFSVAEGEAVGLVGDSGAGKTSLVRLLVGVHRPTAGRVLLGGHAVFTWDRRSFGRHVGFVSQDVELFSATVAENIARLNDDDPSGVIWAAKEAGIHDLVGTLPHGYSTPVGPGGFPLTRGQQQRLAVARALYGNPALIVMDEPDASLDSGGEHALRRALLRAKERGASVVVSTHRTSLLTVFDKLVVLAEGRVASIRTREDISDAAVVDAGGSPALLIHGARRGSSG